MVIIYNVIYVKLSIVRNTSRFKDNGLDYRFQTFFFLKIFFEKIFNF